MPYVSNEALPAVVRTHLPTHAQDIYRAAFNDAWVRSGEDAMSHRTAWSAVKRCYVKRNDVWVPRARAVTDPGILG